MKTEIAPQFPGGEKALFKFLQNNSKIKLSNKRLSTNKVVLTQFILDKEGKIVFAEILKGLDEKHNNEAIELIKQMPAWSPAYQNSRPVTIYVTLPLAFKE